jgi:acyl-CoA thioester hydrolase
VEGYRFSTSLRVRFNETDAQGVAHNAVYLVWLEIARIAYLARVPGGYRGLVADHGVDVTTVEAHVRYRAPARFDDDLRIWARTSGVRGARFRFEYAVELAGEHPSVLAEGETGHAFVDAATLRPRRVPPWLADALAELEGDA